jgi:hypothetical protein
LPPAARPAGCCCWTTTAPSSPTATSAQHHPQRYAGPGTESETTVAVSTAPQLRLRPMNFVFDRGLTRVDRALWVCAAPPTKVRSAWQGLVQCLPTRTAMETAACAVWIDRESTQGVVVRFVIDGASSRSMRQLECACSLCQTLVLMNMCIPRRYCA